MMRWFFAAFLVLSGASYGADKGKGELAFDLSGIEVGQVVGVIYKDALTMPYVLAPELVADKRVIAFRFGGSVGAVRADLVRLLDSLGYAVTARGGVDYIGPKKEQEAEQEVFVYRPRFRDVGYLADVLRPLFKGQFTMNRAIAAPMGAKSDVQAPAGSAAALVDRNADILVFSGSPGEVRKLEKLLAQVDYQQGEVMVRGVVYEVGSSDKEGSAVSLALNLLGGKLSLNAGPVTALENAVRFKSVSIDAVASALSVDSRFKVVSSPSLRVRSGGAGRFSVGQEVPVLGAVTFPGGGQAPVQSVEYRSSGVIFDLQPVVREAAIDITVMQQLSSFVATETGVNGSPTLIKREVKTALSMSDGDIVVLGGLAENKDSGGRNGLSFLPGFLHTRSREGSRSEIVLVLQVTRL